jgi:hypothetical protein
VTERPDPTNDIAQVGYEMYQPVVTVEPAADFYLSRADNAGVVRRSTDGVSFSIAAAVDTGIYDLFAVGGSAYLRVERDNTQERQKHLEVCGHRFHRGDVTIETVRGCELRLFLDDCNQGIQTLAISANASPARF